MKTPELATLMTIPELAAAGIANAARRIRRWCDTGQLDQAGTYQAGKGEPIPLYSGPRAWQLATGADREPVLN